MDAFFILADQHAKSALHDVAYSALPNAPVLPYVEPRRRMRRAVASIRGVRVHRPRALMTRSAGAARATDCQHL
jgi:hypothetical protein